MRYLLLALSLVASLATSSLPASSAADLTGTWQGTMDVPTGPARRVMTISEDHGTYDVVIHSIDESDVPIVTHDVTVRGSNVTMRFDMNTDPWNDYHRVYKATLNKDDTSLAGVWSIEKGPKFPVAFHKVAHASWTGIVPKTRMVTVDAGVKDEVLDWGGSGRAVVLLAGLGNSGHIWYNIIPALRSKYRVYSITRRGYGASSHPAPTVANYSVDRLGSDVIEVLNAYNIKRPVLIGHSIAGEELSDVGTRYPKKVAALIYLDAGYWYAFRSPASTPEPLGTPPPGMAPMPPIGKAVLAGANRAFSGPIDVPILAIFADPHDLRFEVPPAKLASEEARDKKETGASVTAIAHGLPNAKVIRIPNASHYVFISNKDDVLRDINAFIAGLPE